MASLPPDPYKILGVSKDAQLPEIRSAHRKLVLRCHPDKVQDPTLKAAKQDEFQKVQQAYELLSDENERIKYDDNVKLAELRKEMAANGMSANISAPRARTFDVNIRTAEPRPDTFRTTTTSSYRSPGGKMYSQYPSSRSYDEDLHKPSPMFEPRRAASYEKPSRQEEERDRERERERERERRRKKDEDREREREREREDVMRKERERIAIAREKEAAADRRAQEKAAEKAHKRALEKAAEEKEARRQLRKAQEKAEKEREKERRQAAEDKSRRHKHAPYVEPYGEDETYLSKSDKKKSSKKYDEKEKKERARSVPRGEVPLEQAPPMPASDKVTEAMKFAASYMEKSRKGAPTLGRAATFAGFSEPPPVAAPTPPAAAPFAPPPPPVPTADDGRIKSRRSSETKTREKSSHKKSPTKESPYVVEATHSPTSRPMPQFVSAHSSPIGGGSPPKHLGRSNTFNDGYSRPPPGPPRAQTFHYGGDPDRGRGRSRLHPQISEDEDSEDDRRAHRSHRYKVRESEAIPLDYGRSTRYAVSGNRAVPVEPVYASYSREDSPPRVVYYDSHSRPSMPGRDTSYSSSSSHFAKVKTSSRYTPDDVQYSAIPRYTRQDEYAY